MIDSLGAKFEDGSPLAMMSSNFISNLIFCGVLSFITQTHLAQANNNREISSRTSVMYNQDSQTYDLPINTPFNISCDFFNIDTKDAPAYIMWYGGSKGNTHDKVFDSGNNKHQANRTVNPAMVPQQNALNNGTTTLTEELGVPSTGYYTREQPDISYKCQLLTYTLGAQKIYTSVIILSVIDPAKLVGITESQVVAEGARVVLQCNASGIPIPDVTWTRSDGKVLSGSAAGGLSHTSSDGRLVLRNVTASAAGSYICSVTNRVTDTPGIRNTTIEVLYKPILSVHSLIVYQMVGYHTELTCTLQKSNPPLQSVEWYYRSSQTRKPVISEDDRFSYTNSSDGSSTLTIESVRKSDFHGQYCCLFNNSMGASEACIAVKESKEPVLVNGEKPRKSAALQPNHSSHTAVHLSYSILSLILATQS